MEERVISLRKNGTRTISLRKNQETEGENFDYVYVGLRWAPAVIKGGVTGRKTHVEIKTVKTGNFFQKLFGTGPLEIIETEVVDNPGTLRPDKQLDIDLDASLKCPFNKGIVLSPNHPSDHKKNKHILYLKH